MGGKPRAKKPPRVQVYALSGGNQIVFVDGQQCIEVQRHHWLGMIAERMVEAGLDPTTAEWRLPDGRRATVFRVDSDTERAYYNWRIHE